MGTSIYGRLEELNDEGVYVKINDTFAITDNWVLRLPNRTYVSKRRQKIHQVRQYSYHDPNNIEFFDFQCYGIFGWLADVRNYSAVPPLKPSTVLVDDPDDYDSGFGYGGVPHEPRKIGIDCLYAKDLIEFDYSQLIEDRRCSYSRNGSHTCEPGEGKVMTYRTFLGVAWMTRVKFLRNHPNCRLVFWFD